MYPDVPPAAETEAVPSAAPTEVSPVEVGVSTSAFGCCTVTEPMRGHPFASVTVTAYMPEASAFAVLVVCPLLQINPKGAKPL